MLHLQAAAAAAHGTDAPSWKRKARARKPALRRSPLGAHVLSHAPQKIQWYVQLYETYLRLAAGHLFFFPLFAAVEGKSEEGGAKL